MAAKASWAVAPAIAFAGLIACELAVVTIAAAGHSPIVPNVRVEDSIAGPFARLGSGILHGDMAYRWAFAGLVLAMVACYAIVASRAERIAPRWCLVGVAVASVVAVLGPPMLLTDAYNYVNFARLGVLHGLNPYVHPPAAALHDPIYRLASWHRQPTPYGPLFTLLTYPLAWLSVSAALWALKAATVAAAVGAAALLARCARTLGKSPSRAVIVLGLNPIVLVYGLGGVHNDVFMLLALLGAVQFVLLGRERAAGWAGAAAAGLKASALPILPFLVLGARRRLRALAWTAIAGAGVVALTLLVFGHRAPGLAQQQASVTRYSVPHAVAALFGSDAYRRCPGVYVCATHGTVWGATIVLGIGMAFLLWRAWRGADWLASAGWAVVLLILTLTAVMPWYLMWLLPLAILSDSRRLRIGTAVLGGYLLFTAPPFNQLITHLDHHGLTHWF